MAGGIFDFQKELDDLRRPAHVASDQPPLTVTELTARIERTIKGAFPVPLLVRGEVSNFKMYGGSGHAYFTLKDAGACINCVIFKSDFVRVKFEPADGMELLATGRLGIYGQRGSYQFYVTRLEPLGQGALELAYRQLCERLEKEGLFAPERKKPLPRYPMRIALVTSRSTAALQDMLKVLRRFPFLELKLYHVPVQGAGAAEGIASALKDLYRHRKSLGVDVILLGRGGGSLEDLWPFNEEVVARAVAASEIPIITGIGHEVDVSIADLAADYHAHTPTEAAQIATGHWRTASADIDALSARARSGLRGRLEGARNALASIQRCEFFRRPADRVNQLRQRLDDAQADIGGAMRARVQAAGARLDGLALRLSERSPRRVLAGKHQLLAMLAAQLQCYDPRQIVRLKRVELAAHEKAMGTAMQHFLGSRAELVSQREKLLDAISPHQVLQRGYTITTLKKGRVILRSRTQVKPGQRLLTHFADGELESVAEDPNQPTLFE